MPCTRCAVDPQPENFGSPRRCAFDDAGTFTGENWNCATIHALLEHQQGAEHYGDDEHAEVVSVPRRGIGEDGEVYVDGTDGWIITARYKHRGQTSAAVHLTQDGAKPVTLALVEGVLLSYVEMV